MSADNPFPISSEAAALYEEFRQAIPVPALTPKATLAAADAVRAVETLSDEELLGAPALDATMAAALRSGLLLRADRLEESHTLSQRLHTPEGSYWHGIMHRREPDYGNSKYWFGKTGEHPVFASLSLSSVGGGAWNPHDFIDLCESCERGRTPELRQDLETLQELEMARLLGHCFRAAVGR